MKIIIINKKFITYLIFFSILILIGTGVFWVTSNKFNSKQTLYPINISKDNKSYDLNGDGIDDDFEIITGQNQIDFYIKSKDNDFYLSKQVSDGSIFDFNTHWNPKIFFHDISRDNIPEILLLGSKNNKSMCYIFKWNKGSFLNLYSSNKNILGILDSKNTKTPQLYSISSSDGISSLNSFMVINNEILDTTKENSKLISLDAVTKFINLIEAPYELDETPDIFKTSISKSELSLLWNLDKENYSYTFQNGFFNDYDWNDDTSEPVAIKWWLSFEKSQLKGSESDKEELSIIIDLTKEDGAFKISSIQKLN